MKVKALLYCTKGKNKAILGTIFKGNWEKVYHTTYSKYVLENCVEDDEILNGKIVCECEVETEEIGLHKINVGVGYDYLYETDTLSCGLLESRSCLSNQDLQNYLGTKKDNGEKVGYASHISNLKIFETPLELSKCEKDFKGKPASHNWLERVTEMSIDDNWFGLIFVLKAPMNMCWVWHNGERKVLISIRPEWVCKILNGEKKIEVRRKVLKGMVEG